MSKKMLIIIIAVVVVLFLGAVGTGFFMMWKKLSNMNAPNGAAGQAGGGGEAAVQEDIGPIFPLDTFIVNLSDPDGRHYLKVTVNLEINASAVGIEEELQKRLPQIKDVILTLLPTKKSEDIQSVEGKQKLREELMEQLNSLLRRGQIKNIYFSDFVIQ